jgi:hypothetical protein
VFMEISVEKEKKKEEKEGNRAQSAFLALLSSFAFVFSVILSYLYSILMHCVQGELEA